MLHFQRARLDPRDFWHEVPATMELEGNTDLFIGRNVYGMLAALGLEKITIDYVVVDTLRVPRETFAAIIQAWRDGYAEAIGEATAVSTELAVEYFNEMVENIRDPARYAVGWFRSSPLESPEPNAREGAASSLRLDGELRVEEIDEPRYRRTVRIRLRPRASIRATSAPRSALPAGDAAAHARTRLRRTRDRGRSEVRWHAGLGLRRRSARDDRRRIARRAHDPSRERGHRAPRAPFGRGGSRHRRAVRHGLQRARAGRFFARGSG